MFDAKCSVERAMVDRFRFWLSGFIWGKQHEDKVIKYPMDWWEAFKEKWFSVWMVKQWPIKYTTYIISATELYPNLKYALPKESHVLQLAMRKGE